MTTPRIYRTEAIVLKAFDLGEADRILTLFTPNLGKVRAVAKGIRRTKSRKAGHLDLFMRSQVQLAHGRNLDIVTQAETVESLRAARDDLWRSTYCHYVAELIDGFAVEGQASYPLYALATATFRRLNDSTQPELAVRAFELQLLGVSGYRPQLHRCLGCDALIEPVSNRFSAKLGGVLCPACAHDDAAAPAISIPALKILRNLQTNEDAVLSLGDLDEALRREVEQRLQEYITYRLESRPRSAGFVDRLRAEGVK